MEKNNKCKMVMELKNKNISLDDCIKQLDGKVSSVYIRKIYKQK